MAPKEGAVDPRSHLLGASRALVSLSIPTPCVLGRAVHSPAVAGRPTWPSGDFGTLLTCQLLFLVIEMVAFTVLAYAGLVFTSQRAMRKAQPRAEALSEFDMSAPIEKGVQATPV